MELTESFDVQKNKEQLQPVIRTLKSIVSQFSRLDEDANRSLELGNIYDHEDKLKEKTELLISLSKTLVADCEHLDEWLRNYILNVATYVSRIAQQSLENKGNTTHDVREVEELIKFLEK